MTPGTLRSRVVVAASVSILLAIAVLGAGVEVLVARDLHRALDRTLRARAADVARLAVSAPGLLTTPGTLDSPLGGRELSIEVLDRHGRILARSLALGGRLLPRDALTARAIAHGRGGYEDERLGHEHVRLYVAPLADVGGEAAGGAVVVATSTSELDETLSRLREFVLLSAVCAAALGGLAAALLMQRALRPVSRLSAAAAEIERTADHHRRLPEPLTRDEVGGLAATLNGMLGALERARDRERQFVADASHELRTPLTALQGNLAFVARHGAAASDEVVADLEADISRMATLVQDLLTLSREDVAEPPSELVRLDELARDAARGRPGIRVEADEPIIVRADRDALERALANLLRNAVRYGPPDGQVTVSAEQENGLARLTVADEGSGPATDPPELVFERFWRGAHDTGGTGTGLGLAIVRATAERHGGRATVTGSRFTIELPALRELSESVARTAGSPESPKGRS